MVDVADIVMVGVAAAEVGTEVWQLNLDWVLMAAMDMADIVVVDAAAAVVDVDADTDAVVVDVETVL